jgi:hypothetical protein
MDFFDPRDWWPLDPRAGGERHRRRDPEDLDRLLAAGLVAAACLFLGSLHPPGSAVATTASLLIVAALAGVLEAVWRGEAPLAEPRLTTWDQAAILLMLALALRLCGAVGPLSVPGGPVL